jgi:hypothetical protein
MLLEFALPRDYNENMISQNIPSFSVDSPYRLLARSLDALPHRFPPAEDESDLHLLIWNRLLGLPTVSVATCKRQLHN